MEAGRREEAEILLRNLDELKQEQKKINLRGFAMTSSVPVTSHNVASVVKVSPRVTSPPPEKNPPNKNPFERESPPLSPTYSEKLKNILSPLKVRNPFSAQKSKNPFEVEDSGEIDSKNPFLNSPRENEEKNPFVESGDPKNPFVEKIDGKNPFLAEKNPFVEEGGIREDHERENPFIEDSGHVFRREDQGFPVRSGSTISDPMKEQAAYIGQL